MAQMTAGSSSTPEGGEEYSHLTRLQRYSYAAGAVGVWGPLVAFSALRSTIYVIYLEAVRVHAALRVWGGAFRCSCTCQHVRMRTRARVAGASASTPHTMPPIEVHTRPTEVLVPCERRTRRRSARLASSWAGGTRSMAPSSRVGPTPARSIAECRAVPAGANAACEQRPPWQRRSSPALPRLRLWVAVCAAHAEPEAMPLRVRCEAGARA